MAKQTFTTGQVLTAAQMTSLQQTAMGGGAATAKTTSYVLTAADAGTVVQMNAAGATTITVNTALFAAGDSVQIQNIGAGVCTITAGTATVTTAGSLALSQWEGGNLYFTSTSASIFFDIVQSSGMTNPMTTTGDTIYSSSGSTPARLGIGSTGQVLTVASGVPSWATPATAASGMTFISRSTFSSVATKDFDNVFTSSYYTYLFVIETLYAGTSGDDLFLQWRYAGPATQSTTYYGTSIYASYLNTTVANDPTNNNTALRLSRDSSSAASPGNGYFYVNLVGNASEMAALNGQYFTGENGQGSISQGDVATARTYTGFRLLSGSSNITGAVSIYGLAKS